jgi:signal transduction histidine kinase
LRFERLGDTVAEMGFAVPANFASPRGSRRQVLLAGCALAFVFVTIAALSIGAPPVDTTLLLLTVPAIGLGLRYDATRRRLADREVAALLARMEAVVLDNQRLATEASLATREAQQSRARIAASAERERRRIERDLHDGAQQRLVALRIELELAEELVRRDPQRGADRLKELELDVDEALEELRSLAHGVCPPTLADRGVAEAIQVVARRIPISIDVEAHEVERYAPEVESAVYFCVVEALQNVLKHADARRVEVRLDGGRRSTLRFSVRDDGANATDGSLAQGAGISNMRDRLAAVDGELAIHSRAGVGTTVSGEVAARGASADTGPL